MLATDGVATAADLATAFPSEGRLRQGPVAVIECFQEIPCNPCAEACPRGAITMPGNISQRPVFDAEKCNGCGICVTRCPGLAIFVLDLSFSDTEALLKIPYEFRPLPAAGEMVAALNREGNRVGSARVIKVQEQKNKTTVVWLAVPTLLAAEVRNFRMSLEGKS